MLAGGNVSGVSSCGPTNAARCRLHVTSRTCADAQVNGGYGKGDGRSYKGERLTLKSLLTLCAHV